MQKKSLITFHALAFGLLVISCSVSQETGMNAATDPIEDSEASPTEAIVQREESMGIEIASDVTRPIIGRVTDGQYQVHHIFNADVAPRIVRVSPEGEILIRGNDEFRIYKLSDDGSLGVFFESEVYISSFQIGPNGNLWISDGHSLFKVREGQIQKMVDRRVSVFDFDTQGNLYGIEYDGGKGIYRLSSEGTETHFDLDVYFSSGGEPVPLAVSNAGSVFVLANDGRLLHVGLDGQAELLASEIDTAACEPSLFLLPDESLFLNGWCGLFEYDFEESRLVLQDWFDEFGLYGNSGAVDSSGRIISNHLNEPVIAIDPERETIELAYSHFGTSWALDVSPDGQAFLAYGSKVPKGESNLYAVNEMGELELKGTAPYGHADYLRFSQEGIGYLVLNDAIMGGSIFTYDGTTGEFELMMEADYQIGSIAINPINGEIWWTGPNDFGFVHFLDENGNINDLQGPSVSRFPIIDFGGSGILYALVWPNMIYTMSKDGEWESLYAGEDSVELVRLAACPNESLFVTAGVSGSFFQRDPGWWSITTVLQIKPGNEFEIIGFDFPPDGFSMSCDNEGNLYFSQSEGIYALVVEE